MEFRNLRHPVKTGEKEISYKLDSSSEWLKDISGSMLIQRRIIFPLKNIHWGEKIAEKLKRK
jgi:hypothetical protein